MNLQTFFLIEAALFGLIMGSFLNVCIHRLPLAQKMGGRSLCPSCKKMIAWYDNIPLVSYLLLRGKCRHCHVRISPRYFLVELLTAFLSVFTLLKASYEIVPYFLWFLFFMCPLIVISFIDARYRLIPDVISLPGIILGFIVSLFMHWPFYQQALLFSLGGILAGGGSLLLLSELYARVRKKEGMGGGDIKLAAMLGAFVGWQGIIFVFLISSFVALFFAVLALMFRSSKEPLLIPYGPFLSMAAVIYYFFGDFLVHFYFSSMGL